MKRHASACLVSAPWRRNQFPEKSPSSAWPTIQKETSDGRRCTRIRRLERFQRPGKRCHLSAAFARQNLAQATTFPLCVNRRSSAVELHHYGSATTAAGAAAAKAAPASPARPASPRKATRSSATKGWACAEASTSAIARGRHRATKAAGAADTRRTAEGWCAVGRSRRRHRIARSRPGKAGRRRRTPNTHCSR